ncbi:MAG: hypothetical protein LBB91_09875 [Clostridiales bacterium]|jgi:hypothetical protein|nr:hypothetical protein [Clostridiales bacterium]
MKMVQTYQGYFQKGRFISTEPAVIPDNVEVFIMVTDRELPISRTKAQRQLEAFDKFVSAISSVSDEPLTDEDFAELENNRASFDREVAL